MTMVELAVAWCLDQPAVTSPIVGASRADQIGQVVTALDTRLDADLRARLDDAHPPLPRPPAAPVTSAQMTAA